MIFRLSICDSKTGIGLFDLVWNENYVVIPTAIGSLICSFYQIANSFGDKGGVSTILLRPCSHKELFANSPLAPLATSSLETMGNGPPHASRSISAPSVPSPSSSHSFRERCTSPPLHLNTLTLNNPEDSPDEHSDNTDERPLAASRAFSVPSFYTPKLIPLIVSSTLSSGSSSPKLKSSSVSSDDSSSSATPPGSPKKDNPIASVVALEGPKQSPRPLLELRTSYSPPSTLTPASSTESYSSTTTTPTRSPMAPFATDSAPTTPNGDTPPSPFVTRSPSGRKPNRAPPSPPVNHRASVIGGHKRVKSINSATVRLTLEKNPDNDIVVAILHQDNSHAMVVARDLAARIMVEFVSEFGNEITNLRVVLDRIADSGVRSNESLEGVTTLFKTFNSTAEKIKAIILLSGGNHR